jgi:cobalt-zinc-cadmium efflux system protein
MAHDHGPPQTGARLALVIALNFTITIAEVIGGLLSGSLSLISDALHNFSDGVAVVIAWIAMKLSARARDDHYTFGMKRAEVLAASLNAGALVAISIYLFVEAGQRFYAPVPISGGIMITVALIGLVANVLGTLLLRRGADSNMNLRAAYLHLLSDAVSSVGVILGGLAIWLWGISWIDPLLTILIGLYVLKESVDILWQAIESIMLATPRGMDLAEVRQAITAMNGVSGIHHTHLWQVSDHDLHFEAHIELPEQSLGQTEALRLAIAEMLQDRFDIDHTTLQFEITGGQCPFQSLT